MVWLSFLRSKPSQDSRCKKFCLIPLALFITTMSIIAEIFFRHGCHDTYVSEVIEEYIKEYAEHLSPELYTLTFGFTNNFYLLPLSAACCLLTAFINMIIP